MGEINKTFLLSLNRFYISNLFVILCNFISSPGRHAALYKMNQTRAYDFKTLLCIFVCLFVCLFLLLWKYHLLEMKSHKY